MITLQNVLDRLPDTDRNVVVSLSGGIDSTTMLLLAARKYGRDKVSGISFRYGQKQRFEVSHAGLTCQKNGIRHVVVDLEGVSKILRHGTSMIEHSSKGEVPDIQDVIGDPQPSTYVPNRNLLLFSVAAMYAEVFDCSHILSGIQCHDEYSYHDTTPEFKNRFNAIMQLNRKHSIELVSPLTPDLTKHHELLVLKEFFDYDMKALNNMLSDTFTCYNPRISAQGIVGVSCGKCPGCSERIHAFSVVGMKDPIKYVIDIDWDKLIAENQREVV